MPERESKPRRFDRDVTGILLLDKPIGMSSNAALQKARVLFRASKAGHAGSLDPLASGMLPVCFGQSTKICAFLLDARKTYRFTMRLGERTETGDAEGAVVERRPLPEITEAAIRLALQSMVGAQSQIPPMHSALKHQGERLYALARRGETVERASRDIFIESLVLCRASAAEIEIEVRCSKGTYVRVLAEDIAERLGTLAHLTTLRRLQVDPFANSGLRSMEELAALAEQGMGALDSVLLPSDTALPHLPATYFDSGASDALKQGRAATASGVSSAGSLVRMYGPDGVFVGVGEALESGMVQPRRIVVPASINP